MTDKEIYNLLSSVIWQDYKGYKRDLNFKNNISSFCGLMFLSIIGIIGAVAFIIEGDIGIVLAGLPFSFTIFCTNIMISQYIIPWYRMSKVNKVAYDIELCSSNAKIIRTRKKKYGVVYSCDHNGDYDGYLRLILFPKYELVERIDDDCFIISLKKHKRLRYGIYNSSLRKITVPIRFDNITHPDNSANLYIAEKDGEICKFNSLGDRIVR